MKWWKERSQRRARHAKNSSPRRLTLLVESLEARDVPALTTVGPYVVPVASGVTTQAIWTVGESVPESDDPLGTLRMVGIPDGLGAFDNGNGTITVLMNHELAATLGVVRDHGSIGSFVSKLIVDKTTHEVLEGDDLIKTMQLWDTITQAYISGTDALDRLCSADLPAVTALFNAGSGNGTQERIFMSGEESRPPFTPGHGRAFAHIVTGPNAGTSHELPLIGKMSFENVVANPFAQDTTIVIGLDDSERNFSAPFEASTEPSEVYVYIGTKTSAGNEVERAGLTNGNLFGIKVTGHPTEGTLVSGTSYAFTLHMFNQTAVLNDADGAFLQTESIAQVITQFRRVEDGQWDPNNPSDFYFTTTDQFSGTTRVWRVRLSDIANPAAGGTIEMVINGDGGRMFDNMTVDGLGRILLQEDVGNNVHLGRIWIYDIASDALAVAAEHSADFFITGAPNFITQDEESSGIIDVSSMFGPGWYLFDVQAHASAGDAELVERGQFMAMNIGVMVSLTDGNLTILGTDANQRIEVRLVGSNVKVFVNNKLVDTFAYADVGQIAVNGYGGNDTILIGATLDVPTVLHGGDGKDVIKGGASHDVIAGGAGNDLLYGRAGRDILIGMLGNDEQHGGSGSDLLIGAESDFDLDGENLEQIRDTWLSVLSYSARINQLKNAAVGLPKLDSAAITDDTVRDRLFGEGDLDWFWSATPDSSDKNGAEQVG